MEELLKSLRGKDPEFETLRRLFRREKQITVFKLIFSVYDLPEYAVAGRMACKEPRSGTGKQRGDPEQTLG